MFNQNGHLLAAASSDQTVKLWDLIKPEAAPISLRGHEREVRTVAFSPDGETLASASSDKTIRLWDIRMLSAPARVLRGHKDTVWSLAFSPDGETLASASSDNTIMLWMARTSQLSDLVCERVLRNMTFDEWQNLVGEGLPYERTCERLPVHASVIETAANRAKADDVDGAVALFERIVSLDPTLSIVPEQQAKLIAVEALVDRGRKAAQNGDADEAMALLQRAKKLDSTLALSLDQEVANGLLVRSWNDVRQGDIAHAIEIFQQVKALSPNLALLKHPAVNWNSLCWYGSLWGYAAEALLACDQAVLREPKNGAWHYSRGVARGITGDFEGTLEDLRFFVKWAQQPRQQELRVLRQEAWIEALEQGHNPFDTDTLETLKKEN